MPLVRTVFLRVCLALLIAGILPAVISPARGDNPSGLAVQIVRPGQSIQAAIDRAAEGGLVFVLPGVYRETASTTNGVEISKPLRLIGLSTPKQRVVITNAGTQRNGVVVVPQDRTACLSCHQTLAPPFAVFSNVQRGLKMREPMIAGTTIRGITIAGFANNGLFTENLDGFLIADVESVDNRNYGIFPTLSKNGTITRSRVSGSFDSGVWVETSENVRVSDTVVEGNVVGIEVSNSDDIVLTKNEVRDNTVGVGVFLFPFLFDDRPGEKRITIEKNTIVRNNRPNTATPGTLVSGLPPGAGIIFLGADDSRIARNRIEQNGLAGVALIDYCIAFSGSPRDCDRNPDLPLEFLADQDATNNRVEENILIGNGTNPPPHPLAFAASDLALLSTGEGNCYRKNTFTTSFSLFGLLPPCGPWAGGP
jgi:parallel beta-helix repeat protein